MNYSKRFSEGGNLSVKGKFGVKSATKLNMEKFSTNIFKEFKEDFMDFLLSLNDRFYIKYGYHIWEDLEYLKSGNCFSGSSRSLYQQDYMSFSQFKKKVGDFDIQIDENLKEKFGPFIKGLEDVTIGEFTIYGSKDDSSGAQDHCLITASEKYDGLGADYFQVDWEYVDYEDGRPTEFSSFAHYSSWQDITLNIKGLFVKLLLRAISHCSFEEDSIEVSAKTGKPSKTRGEYKFNPSKTAFSVDKGVRDKLAPYLDDDGNIAIDSETGRRKFYKKPTKDSTYTKDLDKIFEIFFGREPENEKEKKSLYSFVRCLELIKRSFDRKKICDIFEYFMELTVCAGAQKLSAFDKSEDYDWKMAAFDMIFEKIPFLKDKYEDVLKENMDSYYENYVERERDSSLDSDSDDFMGD